MFHLRLIHSRLPFALVLVLGAAASLPSSLIAQGTHLWTQSQLEEFEKGTPQGVAITSDGHLREGPGLKEMLTTPSTFVWSVAVDKNGAAYLGTGSPATVLRVGRQGRQALHAVRDQGSERAGGAPGPGRRALRGHDAQRQGLQAESRRDDEAGRSQRHSGLRRMPSWTLQPTMRKPSRRQSRAASRTTSGT